MTKKKLPDNVVNPFSDNFLESWDLWKRFKKEEFSFQYKGVISEQVALMNLKMVANNDEDTAVMIIQQSIGEKWKGLFPLTDKYKLNKNGRQSSTSNTEKSSYRDSVKEEFNKRYGSGQQARN